MREPFLYLPADRVPGQVIAFRPLMVDGFEVESGKKKKEAEREGGERKGRAAISPLLCLHARIGCFNIYAFELMVVLPELKKTSERRWKNLSPPRNLPLYLLSNDDGLTTILGRREEGGEIALATLRELCIFDESESLSLSLLLLLMLAARVFESIVINY